MAADRYIPEKIRKLVADRANYICEYCKIPASFSFFTFQIDHIVSLKHGGSNDDSNLAFCCPICNVNKGTDIATFLEDTSLPIRLYNPRTDNWNKCFFVDPMGEIVPLNNIAKATIKVLDFNHPDSIIERRELFKQGFL